MAILVPVERWHGGNGYGQLIKRGGQSDLTVCTNV